MVTLEHHQPRLHSVVLPFFHIQGPTPGVNDSLAPVQCRLRLCYITLQPNATASLNTSACSY
jgi:hypothetical protein